MDDSFEIEGMDESFYEVTLVTELRCKYCDYTSKRKYNMKRHESVVHKPDQEVPTEKSSTASNGNLCSVCGMSFKTGEGLRQHTRGIQAEQFRFTCTVCHKGYNNLWNYKGHLASHDKTLEERCQTCKSTFRYKSSLLNHKKVCGSSEPRERYYCPVCSSDFATAENLKEHSNVVHEQRTSICKNCGKKYRWRSSLAYHSKKCTGVLQSN